MAGAAAAAPAPRSTPVAAAASVPPRAVLLFSTNYITVLAAAAPPTLSHATLLIASTVNRSVPVTAAARSLPRNAAVTVAVPSLVPPPLLLLPAFPVVAAATTPLHLRAAPPLLVTVDAIPTVAGAAPLPPHTAASAILPRTSTAVVAAAPFPTCAVMSLIVPLVWASAFSPTTALILGMQILAGSTGTSLSRRVAFSSIHRRRRRSTRQRARLRFLLVAFSPVATTATVVVIAGVVAAVFPAFVVTIVAPGREFTPTIAWRAAVVVARLGFLSGGAVDAAVAVAGTAVAIGVTGAVTRRPPRRSRTRTMLAIVAAVLRVVRSVPAVCAFSTRARPREAPVDAGRATPRARVVGDLMLPSIPTTSVNTTTTTSTLTDASVSWVVGPARPVISGEARRGRRRRISNSLLSDRRAGFPRASAFYVTSPGTRTSTR